MDEVLLIVSIDTDYLTGLTKILSEWVSEDDNEAYACLAGNLCPAEL